MTSATWEVVDLVARWVHVVAGIMWVGNSLLFNWLDRNLHSKAEHFQGSGAIWLLHSGGFYYVEKTLLPGQRLPAPLHWFKWQAYTTWWSGLALLVAVYWAGGRASMGAAAGDRSAAVALAVGSIIAGWGIYEAANRHVAPRAPAIAVAIWMTTLVGISWLLLDRLDPRAAFLHVGALLGTIMAGNVVFTIVPSQRQLIDSVERGAQAQAASVSARAKRVSIHNNYFTFPVIALMISNHFSSLYGADDAWLILLVLCASGAAVRHFLNVRYSLRYWEAILTVTMLAAAGLMLLLQGRRNPAALGAGEIEMTFANVRHVIDRRCAACHSSTPTDASFGASPGGVAFDTPAQIADRASRIHERAVATRTMPPANKTVMTDAERDLLARWFAAGSPVR